MKTICAFILLVAALASAQDGTNQIIPILILSTGQVYTNARIDHVTPIDATISFAGGGAKVSLENLPEPFLSQYYDPGKAAEFREVLAKKEAEKKSADQQRQRLALAAWKVKNLRIVDGKEVNVNEVICLDGKVVQVLKKYGGITLNLYEKVSHQSYSEVNELQSIGAYAPGGGSYTKRELGDKVVFVKMDTKGIVDGQDFFMGVFKINPLTLTNVQGAVSTLECYEVGKPYTDVLK